MNARWRAPAGLRGKVALIGSRRISSPVPASTSSAWTISRDDLAPKPAAEGILAKKGYRLARSRLEFDH